MDGTRSNLRSCSAKPDTNLGLWLDRYVGTQKPGPGENKEKAQSDFDARRTQALEVRAGAGYAAAIRRREEDLRELDGGFTGGVTRIFDATADGRVAVGLGQASVWENNVSLSRTWGTPVIPGSALKGLASSYAARNGDASHWGKPSAADGKKGSSQALLFGDLDAAGEVTFHDAWWIAGEDKSLVDRDVMTVHHRGYYGGGKEPPADWDEPNPVGFFTVSGSFLVALSGPPAAVAFAAELLEAALKEDGIGAKTHAGYGRMTLEEKLTRAETDARERERVIGELLTPIAGKEIPVRVPERLNRLFALVNVTEGELRRFVDAHYEHRDRLEKWCAGAPPDQAERVRRAVELERDARGRAPTQAAAVKIEREVKSLEGQWATLVVTGKDVLIAGVDGVTIKPDQKAAQIAGKSSDEAKQFVTQLRERGEGTYRVQVRLKLDGAKIREIAFLGGAEPT